MYSIFIVLIKKLALKMGYALTECLITLKTKNILTVVLIKMSSLIFNNQAVNHLKKKRNKVLHVFTEAFGEIMQYLF